MWGAEIGIFSWFVTLYTLLLGEYRLVVTSNSGYSDDLPGQYSLVGPKRVKNKPSVLDSVGMVARARYHLTGCTTQQKKKRRGAENGRVFSFFPFYCVRGIISGN